MMDGPTSTSISKVEDTTDPPSSLTLPSLPPLEGLGGASRNPSANNNNNTNDDGDDDNDSRNDNRTSITNLSTNTAAATANANATTPAPHLNPRSCVTCRRRKVRCNKHEPCANCVKAGIDCVFPGPGRAPRKSRKPPDAELLSRLRRLEGVVQNLGVQADEHAGDGGVVAPANLPGLSTAGIRTNFGGAYHHPHQHQHQHRARSGESPGSDHDDSKRRSLDKQLGRLVINEDRSRYVSNTFWTAMSDEVCIARGFLSLPPGGYGIILF